MFPGTRGVHVGLDVDGVVADFSGYVLDTLDLDPSLNTCWDFGENYGAAVDRQVTDLCHDPATWVSLKPLPGAKDAVNAILHATKSAPVFITSMGAKFVPLRRWWLEEHFGKALEGRAVYLYQCHGEDKPQKALEQGLTHFVEDKPENASLMAAAGLTSVLVPSTYMGRDVDDRVQIMSLTEFAQGLRALV